LHFQGHEIVLSSCYMKYAIITSGTSSCFHL
jgi:hypothetical protein